MGMKDRFRADRDFIDGVLNDADDMVVALNDGDGAPYAFPVNFVLLATRCTSIPRSPERKWT